MGWYISGFPFTSHALLTQGNLTPYVLWKSLEIFTMFEDALKSLIFALFAGSVFYGPIIPTDELPPNVANINLQS